VRWPPACKDVSPAAEECPLLSYLRVAVVRREKRVAEAGDSSVREPRGKERPPLEAATKQRLVKKKCMCAVFTVIFGVCISVRLS
jgi:hypothetical protein